LLGDMHADPVGVDEPVVHIRHVWFSGLGVLALSRPERRRT
jgi:hypothetical protein